MLEKAKKQFTGAVIFSVIALIVAIFSIKWYNLNIMYRYCYLVDLVRLYKYRIF